MVSQKLITWKGKFTNIFYLSKMLSRVFFVVLALIVLVLLGLLSSWIFPHWYCADCQNIPQGCSAEYPMIVAQGDITFCENMTTLDVRWEYDNYCREQCKADIAVNNQNPEQCESIQRLRVGTQSWPSLRDSCFMSIARALNEISLCKRAETLWAQQECAKLK